MDEIDELKAALENCRRVSGEKFAEQYDQIRSLEKQRDAYQVRLASAVKALQSIASGEINGQFAASGEMMHLAEETLHKLQSTAC